MESVNQARTSCGLAGRLAMTVIAAAAWTSAAQAQDYGVSAMKFSGDARLRYEHTANQQVLDPPPPGAAASRDRGVFRFRAGVTMPINEMFSLGARMATGDPDDPNSTDVTLGSFVDDLQFTLDRAYLEFNYKGLMLTGGKFQNPFRTKTDIVWDDDVNPQGVGGRYTFSGTGAVTPRVAGLYSIIDEQSTSGDSYMLGGQFELGIRASSSLTLTAAAGYYDYTIKSLTSADAGDVLTNNLNADTTGYRSDFNLFDLIGIVEYNGWSERFPLRIVGDYVKNTGAEVPEDQGYSVDAYLGRVSNRNDVRFQYGYSNVETDAVLGAFSHDNTTLPTNYMQHTFNIDFVLLPNTVFTGTFYLYRRSAETALTDDTDTFASRLRLNLMLRF